MAQRDEKLTFTYVQWHSGMKSFTYRCSMAQRDEKLMAQRDEKLNLLTLFNGTAG